MAYVSDAQLEVTVDILQPCIADILEDTIVAPEQVAEDTPFTIEVTIKNVGETGTLYAQLLDADENPIPDTAQEQELTEDEEWVVTFNVPGQTVDEFVCIIDAGHVTPD